MAADHRNVVLRGHLATYTRKRQRLVESKSHNTIARVAAYTASVMGSNKRRQGRGPLQDGAEREVGVARPTGQSDHRSDEVAVELAPAIEALPSAGCARHVGRFRQACVTISNDKQTGGGKGFSQQ